MDSRAFLNMLQQIQPEMTPVRPSDSVGQRLTANQWDEMVCQATVLPSLPGSK